METTSQFDRLCMLREWLQKNHPRMSSAAIERKLGVKAGYFQVRMRAEAKSGVKNLRYSTLKSLVDSWKRETPDTPPLSFEWISKGEGEMFASGAVLRTSIGGGVAYYNVDLMNGFDEFLGENSLTPDYYITYSPFERDANAWCNYTGESMSPKLSNGDKICVSRLLTLDEIIYGEMYAIQTRSGMRTVRWVSRSENEECLRLIPENKDPRYGVYQDVPKSEIQFIYKVLGAIRTF